MEGLLDGRTSLSERQGEKTIAQDREDGVRKTPRPRLRLGPCLSLGLSLIPSSLHQSMDSH